jgi:sugar phosphate isomerase/epimerase
MPPRGPGSADSRRSSTASSTFTSRTSARAAAWTRIGDGIVDFRAQLSCLYDAGYDGYLSFETHYVRDGSGELATRDCVAALRALT